MQLCKFFAQINYLYCNKGIQYMHPVCTLHLTRCTTHLCPFSKSKLNLYEEWSLTAPTLLHRLVLSIVLGTVQGGTGKVDPARKFKCTTAARGTMYNERNQCLLYIISMYIKHCASVFILFTHLCLIDISIIYIEVLSCIYMFIFQCAKLNLFCRLENRINKQSL